MEQKEFEASLKSIETENYIDRKLYRPLGFLIANALRNTGITPNTITIISIFFGVLGGFFFHYPYSITFALLGILALICANILDCVDGQLARLTGIKSEIGRILDGFAGDIWFACIYLAFAYRLNIQFNTWLFTIVIVISAISHINQAALTDYYKTLHLFFISEDKGKEFENSTEVRARYEAMPKGISKFFSYFYIFYTKNQEKETPKLQALLRLIREKYGRDIPDSLREDFRKDSRKLMPIIDMLTFNGRSIVMFICVLTNVLWVYFIWEIIVLKIVQFYVRRKHEQMCEKYMKRISN